MVESEQAKERYVRYRQSEKGKISQKERDARYRQSERGREKKKAYVEANRERINEYQRNRKHKSPISVMLTTARRRAKVNGIEFSISKEDVSIPDRCPVLGTELKHSNGKASQNSPSLDRVNNSLGYVKGNVRVISYRANLLKNDASIEELKRVVEYMEKNQCAS